MLYAHVTDRCFAETIGDGGLSRADYDRALARTAPALEGLRTAHADGNLPLLGLPGERADLGALRPVAARFREAFSDVVILGTGGSSLGGQTLYALADKGFGPPAGAPRLHFVDNVDPDTFDVLLASLDLVRTGFVAISKSGSTTETVAQFLVCHEAVRGAVGATAGEHFVLITEPADNPMRRLAAEFGMKTLDHDPGVGGRFSVLSAVGVLPALMAGLDAEALRTGAAEVLGPMIAGVEPADVPAAAGAAIAVGLNESRGVTQTVLMPYVDRLADFGLWFRQLWAESLGKGGRGTTPIRAVGTVDQHSQLQLYLDGPADKMFTIVTLDCAGAGPQVPAHGEALSYLAGKTMGDVMDAEQRATIETLALNGRPTRVFSLAALDERSMGALMMHFMLETIVAAHLLGVNPFDQPAVEEGKVLTRQYLAGGQGAAR